MRGIEYDRVCYRTEQREEAVRLRNMKTGDIGYSFGCTQSGKTVQVRLNNGELDSWAPDECIETEQQSYRDYSRRLRVALRKRRLP